MITYVAKAINLLASLLTLFIDITSAIGEVIVLVITSAFLFIVSCIASLLKFFQIVYEDNVSIFTEDLPNLYSRICEEIYHPWLCLHGIMVGMCNETVNSWNLLNNNIKWSFGVAFMMTSEVLHMVKNSVICLGDTLWFVLTFVPVHLPYLVKLVRDIIINFLIEAYMELLKVINFLSDIPLESFLGIISAIIIIRSCIYFREAITYHVKNFYWIVLRKFLYLYHTMYNYFTNSHVRLVTQIMRNQAPLRNEGAHIPNDNEDAVDTLCVICQERQKRVLTLPCRHVCLCAECCVRLYTVEGKCPICRTFIYHSFPVYL